MKMKPEDFFELTPDQQENLVKIWRTRKDIRRQNAMLEERRQELANDTASLQNSCPHHMHEVKKRWDEDEYGKTMSYGTIKHSCVDCGLVWFEDFKDE